MNDVCNVVTAGLFVPVVSAERAYGQAVAEQIAVGPVFEGVSYGHRLLHRVALYIHFAALYPCFCGMEHAVFACHFKQVALQSVASVYPHVGAVERNHGRVVLERYVLIVCAFGCQTLNTVGLAQCEQCEAHAGKVLLARMYAVFKSGIHKHSHAAVGVHQFGLCLLFAQQGAVYRIVNQLIVVRSNLAVVEREVAQSPL